MKMIILKKGKRKKGVGKRLTQRREDAEDTEEDEGRDSHGGTEGTKARRRRINELHE
jgi:hypothetical protein